LGAAKQEAHAALALSPGKDVLAISAMAMALAGDSSQPARIAEDLAKQFPEDTVVQTGYLPMIRAAIVLGENASKESNKAIAALAATSSYELGNYVQTMNFALYPVYLRGQAYLAGKQGAAAAAEFQKIVDRPGIVLCAPIGALAHLGLGRAYALSGDKGKARTAYQDFFALWKDADPDVAILKEAKAEYGKLQ
jgi:tetratricopeptide (TPR) repeat protein